MTLTASLAAVLTPEVIESLRQATWTNDVWRERLIKKLAPTLAAHEQQIQQVREENARLKSLLTTSGLIETWDRIREAEQQLAALQKSAGALMREVRGMHACWANDIAAVTGWSNLRALVYWADEVQKAMPPTPSSTESQA